MKPFEDVQSQQNTGEKVDFNLITVFTSWILILDPNFFAPK